MPSVFDLAGAVGPARFVIAGAVGIGPTLVVLETTVLPLNDAPFFFYLNAPC